MDESQPTPISVEHCKDLLRMIAKMMCVKAELISTRLLSKDDKHDMLNDLIPLDALINHVKVWIVNGTPNYSNGNTERIRHEIDL
jgi:hypothetical protein